MAKCSQVSGTKEPTSQWGENAFRNIINNETMNTTEQTYRAAPGRERIRSLARRISCKALKTSIVSEEVSYYLHLLSIAITLEVKERWDILATHSPKLIIKLYLTFSIIIVATDNDMFRTIPWNNDQMQTTEYLTIRNNQSSPTTIWYCVKTKIKKCYSFTSQIKQMIEAQIPIESMDRYRVWSKVVAKDQKREIGLQQS